MLAFIAIGPIFYEANEPSSACYLRRIYPVETSTPPCSGYKLHGVGVLVKEGLSLRGAIIFRLQLAGSLAGWVAGAAQEGFSGVGAGFCGSLDHGAVALGAGGESVVFGGCGLLPVFQAFGGQRFRIATFYQIRALARTNAFSCSSQGIYRSKRSMSVSCSQRSLWVLATSRMAFASDDRESQIIWRCWRM